jgi:dTDP-4-dehydrorhamnose reductase
VNAGKAVAPPLELWAGVECTVIRIGDEYRNQIVDTGHSARFDDIDAIAGLGIKAVRYPIIWETVAPESPHELDFSWHDKRLDRLREHGIKVIAGLLHHGSGPRYTSFLEDDFAERFADYAAGVARRYPWIDAWTPINEPLTTARMSCLYGHWYPHKRDIDTAFKALVNQCRGISAAMRAVRSVNPASEHIFTEDIGKTFSTAELDYQAEHENERRWLSLDLLTGKVVPGHKFHGWLINKVTTQAVLDEIGRGDGAPDIIGVDHYLTSERFLDHRINRYPVVAPGSNGRHTYVDVEAVRVSSVERELGPAERLREVWDRYGLPVALTEVHHGCTREEQVRWLHQVWSAAEQARAGGIDVRAVTLWALFGTIDWRSLLLRRDGVYDVGAFDIRSETPRPTLVAKTAARLGRGERFDHPLLDLPGWWKRPGRCHARPRYDTLPRVTSRKFTPLLITGAGGTLGQAFARICAHRGLPYVAAGRDDLDIGDAASVQAAIDRFRPWAIVNAAGFLGAADKIASDDCFRTNVTGPELLARACKLHGLPLVTFSSDRVFDGTLGRAYVEPDEPAPLCAYGRSKAEAESRLLAIDAGVLIVRTSAFFGPWDCNNFLFATVAKLKRGQEVIASDRTIVSPTYVPDLVHAALELLLDEETGIWHLTNRGAVSWHELACAVADMARLGKDRIRRADHSAKVDTSLSSKRGLLLRPLDRALSDFVEHCDALRAFV